MNSKIPLAAAILALAIGACACGEAAPAATDSSAAAAEKKTETKKPDAKATVPDAPKTPAPNVEAKTAKTELVPLAKRAEPPAPESWDVIQDNDFGLQFRVPSRWNAGTTTTDSGGNVFVAAPPDESLMLTVVNFENPDLTDEQLLSRLIDNLGFEADGEYQRIDDGLVVAHGTGMWAGQDVYFMAMVYAYDNDNYVTYIVTPQDQAAKNKETMRQILESFEVI